MSQTYRYHTCPACGHPNVHTEKPDNYAPWRYRAHFASQTARRCPGPSHGGETEEHMELVIRIGLDGAAFEDYGVEEVSRILESVAGRIPDPLRTTSGGALSCHDANGNHCGTAEIIDDREALILSAAPDLFAALRSVLRYCVTPKGLPDVGKGRTTAQQAAMNDARAAIAKAEGGGR